LGVEPPSDTALPGYLMLGVRMPTTDLSLLCPEALAQFGTLLAGAQKHLYIGWFGHAAGHALHFHLIPICGWVRQLFFDDPRYAILKNLQSCARDPDDEETGGAELMLYVWREFRESPTPPPISGLSIDEVVERLKALVPA